MLRILTRAKLSLIVLALVATPAGAAFAEGNGPAYGGMVTSAPAMSEVGQGYLPNPQARQAQHLVNASQPPNN